VYRAESVKKEGRPKTTRGARVRQKRRYLPYAGQKKDARGGDEVPIAADQTSDGEKRLKTSAQHLENPGKVAVRRH